MKLLFSYTWDYIKRNRRSSAAIMVAVLMAATMLSALCGFFYNMYADNLRYILRETGDWHGELYDNTKGSKLDIINKSESVESVMVKGAWKIAKIEDPRRDYLVWRDANKEYWESMPEGDWAISGGRSPAAAGEVALSKQYFENHPELKLGDSITLPVGNRAASDGSTIGLMERKQLDETFVPAGEVSLKVVGKLDVTTSSTTPAYTAIGFLDNSLIAPQDDITVYLRFKNIQDTYQELPKIAKAVGYEPNEYGKYELRYNTEYLTRKMVLSPQQISMVHLLLAGQMPLMFGVMGLLVAGIFVLVIHNAFMMSARARLSQLGILASVGATPKQIKQSVVLEALLLTAVPLPLGLLAGQIVVKVLLEYTRNIQTTEGAKALVYVAGWQSLVPAVVLTLLTIWWSAVIPARRVAKLSPIAAIRQGDEVKLKNPRRHQFFKLFGLIGELAGNAVHARKKSYRTATISLVLSFFTLVTLLCINSASAASRAVYHTDTKRWDNQDIVIRMDNVPTSEDYTSVTQNISSINHVSGAKWYNQLRAAVWLKNDRFSSEFNNAGGFKAAKKKIAGMELPLLRESKRRVDVIITGMDDKSFSQYCQSLNLETSPFYKTDSVSGILYNSVEDITTTTKRNPVLIPYLNIEQGAALEMTEKTRDDYEGDFTFGMRIGAVADKLPDLGDNSAAGRYDIRLYMPMSRVNALAESFARKNTTQIIGVLCADKPAQIAAVREKTENICESYFGSGDYEIRDENEEFASRANSDKLISIIFGFVTALLAVIGLSNAWSTVLGTLASRRREFAVLRSVGLPPQGLRKMLLLEAGRLGLTPIILSLPLAVLLQLVFLRINEVTLIEWLPFVPWKPILLYIAAILTVITGAYIIGGRKLMKENIIEGIKLDMI